MPALLDNTAKICIISANLNTNNLIINKKMKKLFFLLTLCFLSLNIYAQRDTIFSVESEAPIVLSVPGGVCNPDATVEQNVIAWRTKKPVALNEGKKVIAFNWFKIAGHRIQKILFFNPITQKNEITKKNITTKVSYIFEIIFLYIFICFITTFLVLIKVAKKELKLKVKPYKCDDFYRDEIDAIKNFIMPVIIFFYICSVLFSIFFLGVHYSSYSIPGLFLPALIFLVGVMTPIIVRKIYRIKKQEKEYPEVGGDLKG